MKIKLLLTFDYELYFGENYYSEDKVLFEPTQKLLDMLRKNNTKAVFFIDICSIIAYTNNNTYEYRDKFKKQINDIKNLGHDIQMHFHPHWMNSKYDTKNKKWLFDHNNYSYSNLIDNYGLEKANNLFFEAHSLLIDIVGGGYSPKVFRAGGYSIQPHEQELIKLLKNLNYKIDTSVIPYKEYISDAQFFNFLNCEEMNRWNISNNSFLKIGESKLLEFPILSLEKGFNNIIYYAILRLINKMVPDVNFNRRGMGVLMNLKKSTNNSLSVNFDMKSHKHKKIISFITKKYIKKFKSNKEIYLNILSHPKAIFDESLEVMDWYINHMKKNMIVNLLVLMT